MLHDTYLNDKVRVTHLSLVRYILHDLSTYSAVYPSLILQRVALLSFTMRLLRSLLPTLVILLCTMTHVVSGVAIPIEVMQRVTHHDAKAQGRLLSLLTHSILSTTFLPAPTHPQPLTGEVVNVRFAEAKDPEGVSYLSLPGADGGRMSTDEPKPRKRARGVRYHP